MIAVVVAELVTGCAVQSADTDTEVTTRKHAGTMVASPETTAATGVITWETYVDGPAQITIGLDLSGTVAYEQEVVQTETDEGAVVSLRVLQPVQMEKRMTAAGATDVVASDDARLQPLLTSLAADMSTATTDDAAYCSPGMCIVDAAACVGVAAACALGCATVVGCAACIALGGYVCGVASVVCYPAYGSGSGC